jgi:hypothetical protein
VAPFKYKQAFKLVLKRANWFLNVVFGSKRFSVELPKESNTEIGEMNKKIVAVLAVALIAVVGTSAFLAITWTGPATVTLTVNAGSSSSPSITLVSSCVASPGQVFGAYTFPNGFVSGTTYTVTFYVVNTGSQLVYLYYTPGTFSADDTQTYFTIAATVIEAGNLQCQMNNLATPVPLTVKVGTVCSTSVYALGATAVAKIKVDITVWSINPSGAPWTIPLTIWGCIP